MREEPPIEVSDLVKTYKVYRKRADRVREAFHPLRRHYHERFHALSGVSFAVSRGETIGILGRNGSGKSTLLGLLCGILPPTAGTVKTRGRLSALLDLGAGFHPEYTGRQNVFMTGALYGQRPEDIRGRFEEIAAFADIGAFMDRPVKTYSSGMFLRLAFSIHAHMMPDILVIDECIAVGDIGFQRKCYKRLEELKRARTTIVMVTHDTNAVVTCCDRAMLLKQGRLIHVGDPKLMVELYHKDIFGEELLPGPVEDYGTGEATIEEVWFEDAGGGRIASVTLHQPFCFCYRVRFHRAMQDPIFGMRAGTVQGHQVLASNTHLQGIETGAWGPEEAVTVRWRIENRLNLGFFFFTCGCSYPDRDVFLCRKVDAVKLGVLGSSRESGLVAGIASVGLSR